jgi:hypothetical protein
MEIVNKLSTGLAVLVLATGFAVGQAASPATDAPSWAPDASGEPHVRFAETAASPSATFAARATRAGVVFRLPVGVAGRVTVLDVWGRVVWSRQADDSTAELAWDGRGTRGAVARGVYVARFQPQDARRSTGAALERKFTLNP